MATERPGQGWLIARVSGMRHRVFPCEATCSAIILRVLAGIAADGDHFLSGPWSAPVAVTCSLCVSRVGGKTIPAARGCVGVPARRA